MYQKFRSEDENRVLVAKIGSRQIIKSILKILEFQENENVLLSEIEFRREAHCRFFQIQKF